MGKEFSANVFNELFKDESQTKQNIYNSDKDSDWQSNLIETSQQQNNQDENSTILPSLLEQHGVDYEEEAFTHRMEFEDKKRKKLRNKGF